MLQSSIAWIDFSEQDRRKMMEVVALFKQRDTRDELGLGSIRDAFADLFFPGGQDISSLSPGFTASMKSAKSPLTRSLNGCGGMKSN
jgi:hypothetical protein